MIQVVSFSCSLAYTGKYGISAVLCSDVTDKLLNKNCLTNTGTAEKTDFTTLLIRAKEIYDFNTGFKKFCFG